MKEDIIKIIIFFDLFDYPLTPYEIWRALETDLSLGEFFLILEQNFYSESPGISSLIARQRGFYFLRGREEIVDMRARRYNYAQRKLKVARLFGRLFSYCPWVKMVAWANVIGAHNLRDDSDIDFFIITDTRRIWLSRLYCTGLAQILYRRPRLKNKRDKLCLSFYLSDDHLDLSFVRLGDQDPYFDYWLRGLVLLYNKNKTYDRFLAANHLMNLRAWLRAGAKAEINSQSEASANKLQPESESIIFSQNKTQVVGQRTGLDILELGAKVWQMMIMPPALKQAAGQSDGVMINDQILKFYLRDRRRSFLEQYEQKIRTHI